MSTAVRPTGLNTVSLRRRLTVVVIAVLGLVLVALGLVVNAVFAAQSERNLDALLSGRVQLARQLARNGVGAQALVNRVGADGVRAHLVLRSGAEFGTQIEPGDQIRTTSATLNAAGRLNRAELTLAVDTSLVDGAKATLRRALIGSGLAALALSALLVAIAVRLALRPLTSMATLARTIADGQRGQRLDPTRVDTELGQTASAFDEMLDELEGAESRARLAEERTRAFLADAAHELRTPIAGVQTAAETLLHGGSQLGPAQREQLEVLLVREAQRAGQLVSDLLVTARLDVGVELTIAPLALRSLVLAEVDRARLLQPGVAFELTGPDLTVAGDRDKIGSILRNLIDNALRACGPTGTIDVRLSGQPGRVVVEVQDSGPGVGPDDRERIFDRLVRLDASRAQDRGGSGLGLAIARGFARAHGGDLTCEPPTHGALFRLSLPG
ncbi:MAG: HAMP domain-containing sensor histidine kinase [Propionibacteriaceae bacterium]